MHVTPSVENYLEAIYVLSRTKPDLHAADICAHLGFSRPTVSVMLKNLKHDGYVTVDDHNHVRLTPEGQTIAIHIYERHEVLSQLLISLGVSKDVAYEDACKMEHDISDESFDCIKKHFAEIHQKKA